MTKTKIKENIKEQIHLCKLAGDLGSAADIAEKAGELELAIKLTLQHAEEYGKETTSYYPYWHDFYGLGEREKEKANKIARNAEKKLCSKGKYERAMKLYMLVEDYVSATKIA